MPQTSSTKQHPKLVAIGAELLPDVSESPMKPKWVLSPLVFAAAALAVLVTGVAMGTFIALTVVRGQEKHETLQEQSEAAVARADKLIAETKEHIAESEAKLARLKKLNEQLPAIVEQAGNAELSGDKKQAQAVIDALDALGFFQRIDNETGRIVVDALAWDRLSQIPYGRERVTRLLKRLSFTGEMTLFNGDTGQSVGWVNEAGKVTVFR